MLSKCSITELYPSFYFICFKFWDRVLLSSSWLWTCKSPALVSWVVVSTGGYHHAWLVLFIDSNLSSFFSFSHSGILTQGCKLARQALYHLSHSTSPFSVDYFWDRVSLYALAGLDSDPPNYASLLSWYDSLHQLDQSFVEMGSC
jgi:hypothetical protein